METPKKKKVSLASAPNARPSFANATQVMVSDDSVLLQFAFIRPKTDAGQLVSEIVLSPKHAIELGRTLEATLKKHFTRHLDPGAGT